MRTIVSVRGRLGIGAVVLAVAAALGITACGSSAPAGTEADPATLAPSSSVLYLSAAVRPEGTLRQDATTDLRKLSHVKEPFAQLLQAVAGAGALGKVDFKREVEPWVGAEAGVFASSPEALASAGQAIGAALGSGFSPEALLKAASAGLFKQGAAAALVLDTRDLDGAKSFVGKLASRDGAHHAVYRGVGYDASGPGTAEAIVGKFAVFGDEAGVKQAIDTHLGGASLAGSGSPYAKLAAKEASQPLASVYLSPQSGQAASVLAALPGEPKQARVSIVPRNGSFQIDADLLAPSGQAESQAATAASAGAGLVASLPGNSWLAAGLGESGAHAARYLSLIDALVGLESKSLFAGFGGPALQTLLGKLNEHAAAVQRTFSGWAGPAAAFAAGSGLLSIQAGLVIESSAGAAAARAAVAKLGALLRAAGANVSHASVPGAESALRVRLFGLPVVLYVGAGGGKLVIGLGPGSVQGALSPTGALSGSGAYGEASSSLGGEKPSVLVSFPMALALLEGLGLGESPSLAPTLGYLRSLGTLAGAVQPLGGGVLRMRLVAALQ